jgi:hypothetical protein
MSSPMPQPGQAGVGSWPAAGTIPQSIAITDGTYTIVAESVAAPSVYLKVQDGANPGVDPVQAGKLGLLGGAFYIYDPIGAVLAKVVGVETDRFEVDNTELWMVLDRPLNVAAATVIQRITNCKSFSFVVSSAPVSISGLSVPAGFTDTTSGFKLSGNPSSAPVPVTYDTAGGGILYISVNP